jgi:hypothetical protein
MLALVFTGCHHDREEHKQSYEDMLLQYQEWARAAALGEGLNPSFGVLAEDHCRQARRDQATIAAARPLAKACDASLESIRDAAEKAP